MAKTTLTPAEALIAAMEELVPGLGGKPITGDEVEFHDRPKIILPRGMTYDRAYKILARLEKEAETPTSFDRKFLYRADDGAYATFQVIKERYGMLLGKTQMSFFGLQPAETRNISIGVGQTMQVPWGLIEIPIFPGLEVRLCDQHADRDYGRIFEIHAEGPQKYKDEMEAFFDAVEAYLKKNSIYRGHAISGSDDPDFLDTNVIDPKKIVFSTEVENSLRGLLWTPIRHTKALRREGLPLKRTVLLEGPYGTGKSSIALLTAIEAVNHGWTFISARPGRDTPEDVLRTARLYQPAVVFIEDIDNASSSGEDDDVTKLLEAFDGITSKGGELMVVMTTNHPERIHKGMLRPGRLDAVIHVAGLDPDGVERLVKALIPESKIDPAMDYDAVGKAMDGYYPAFVVEAINRSIMFAISRDGKTDYFITTDDLIQSATSLKPQLAAMDEAGEGTRRPALDTALKDTVRTAVKELVVDFQGTAMPITDALVQS